MTDLITLAKGKLNDPILMEWALRHYHDAQAGTTQQREAMEQDWFDDLTLRCWLEILSASSAPGLPDFRHRCCRGL